MLRTLKHRRAHALDQRVAVVLRFRRYSSAFLERCTLVFIRELDIVPQINFPFNALQKGKEKKNATFPSNRKTSVGANQTAGG